MKTNRIYSLMTTLLLMMVIGVQAQENNKLYIPDVSATGGKEFQLPIHVQNTNQKITALQFTIKLPKGVDASKWENAIVSERMINHKVSVRSKGDSIWTVIAYSPDNTTIIGNSGTVLSLPTTVADSIKEGSSLTMEMSRVVLSDSLGKNVITNFECGKITIGKTPDFIVSDVKCDVTTINPEDNINVEWIVKNDAQVATTGGWSERIFLVSEAGDVHLIKTTHANDEILAGGASTNRKTNVKLERLLGVDGKGHIRIEIVPNSDSGEREANRGNNIGESTNNAITINKRLYLTIPARIEEPQEDTQLSILVERSGSWAKELTLSFIKEGDNRIKLPEQNIIPKNSSAASFYLTIINDDQFNTDSVFKVKVSADGYETISSQIVIVDNDESQLTVKASKTEVLEGEKIQLTITNQLAPKSDLKISINCDHPDMFKIPSEVTMPKGKTSVTVDVESNEDSEVTDTVCVSFKVTAEKHEEGEALILLVDNDMPELELQLKPTTISEGDGPTAIVGKIIRKSNTNNTITIKLSDNSGGQFFYGLNNNTLEMRPGVTETEFSMGAVDNTAVDGVRKFIVTAAVYFKTCDCTAKGTSIGSVSKEITVIDNDGPCLNIVSASGTSIKEGEQANLTISLNTDTNQDVSVQLSSDYDDMLVYEHTVIIPAGKKYAEVVVTAKTNDNADDNRTIVFTVKAEGYAEATCWMQLTDQTLPDVSISSLQIEPKEIEAGQTATVKVTFKNSGHAVLPSLTRVNLYVNTVSEELTHIYTADTLSVGKEVTLTEEVTMPNVTGDYYFYAIVNKDESVKEVTYANNSSERVGITLTAPFAATAKTDKNIYKQGETVIISGMATGSNVANTDVEIYLINDGTRQTITAKTDVEGNYSTEYTLMKYQSGNFVVGACYPKEGLTTEMGTFDVYGIELDHSSSTTEFNIDEVETGNIIISNPVGLEQTGLKIEQLAESPNCTFSFSAPNKIDANGNVIVSYTITPSAISGGTNWQKMPIKMTTNEGAIAEYTFSYYVHSLNAVLKADKSKIVTTMTKNATRDYPITIKNIGKEETGKITLALPEWMKTATPREMASLSYGDSATIILRMTPTEEMKLNIPVEGNIGINCENGDGLKIEMEITPVSESKGKLIVDVVDEFTFNTKEAPHVANATLQVKHPVTEEIITEAVSGNDGKIELTLPEGQYEITVKADKHEPSTKTIMVDPGKDNSEEIFISCEAVTYDFVAVPTEIEDQYEFETIVKYDVRVPKPIILVSLPNERPQAGSIIPITVTNKGFINTVNVNVTLALSSSNYDIEFLNEPHLDVLAANQTVVFYARLNPKTDDSRRRAQERPSDYECERVGALVSGDVLCGDKYDTHVTGEDRKLYGQCFGHGGFGWVWGSIGGGGGGGTTSRGPLDNSPKDVDSNWWQRENDRLQEICDKRFPYDPNNPNNPNRPDDPITLPLVKDGELKKLDCDSEELPKFVYKLIPVSGPRYQMNGVAADGVSQLKIVLDPEESKIPEEGCDKYTDFEWYVRNDRGTIKGESFKEAIYTAPDTFPSKDFSSVTVEADMSYTYHHNSSVAEVKHVPVKIELIRPPVVFVHGLGDSQECWSKLDTLLVKQRYYKDGINYRADYEKTNTSAFHINVPVIYSSILKVQRRALSKGYAAQKCDIVGHSMGGILTRLYLQEGGNRDLVNRIITVNTPHAGSEFGDAVMAHNVVIGALAMLKFKGLDAKKLLLGNINAVRDLAVESDAITHLNSVVGSSSGISIPVYAIATESKLDCLSTLVGKGLGKAGTGLIKAKHPLAIASGLIVKYFAHFFEDDLSQIGDGDCVVSTESQLGECKANYTIKDGLTGGPWHVASPKDYKVMSKVRDLLVIKDKEPFSTDWFSPKKRPFDHSLWLIKEGIDLVTDFADFPTDKMMDLKKSVVDLSKEIMAIPRRQASDIGEKKKILKVDLEPIEGFGEPSIIVNYGDAGYYMIDGYNAECEIPSTFSGEVYLIISMKGNDGKVYLKEDSMCIEHSLAKPISIQADDTYITVGEEESLRLLCTWDNGEETFVNADNMVFETEGVASFADNTITGIGQGYTEAVVSYAGLTCRTSVRVFGDDTSGDDNNDDEDEPSDNVCSTVSLSFKQEMVMTRQAFRGTLTVDNGKDQELTNVKLNLEVRDSDGNLATTKEFQINAETLDGFKGEVDLGAGWTLDAKGKGIATILFIPTKNAAPTKAKDWSFGGSFSYTDPTTNLTVKRELYPVTLTVNPSPNLEMDYFMQRDVMGDDPLTENIVEESVPAEFSLLINNKGYGDATNVRMVTHQPEIIDNEKGLLIDFELFSSQLNGGDKTLALGDNVATDFGTIPAGKTSYAQWWFTSTLLGHFSEYDVKTTHVTSYGNPDLSLLDAVKIHELIHTLSLPKIENSDIPQKGFLVNDVKDSKDLPDMLYLTDGTTAKVTIATATATYNGDNQYTLITTPKTAGWNYGSIADPTGGRKNLISITRQSDGATIDLTNFWQTDRTLRDGKDPLYEYRLHFADQMTEMGETYILTFEDKPTTIVTQDYHVAEGWNWMSFNFEDEDMADAAKFFDPIAEKMNRLVGQKSELTNDPVFGIIGGLTELKSVDSYKVLMNESSEFSHSGTIIEPSLHAIDLKQGWNWIGYLPEYPLTIDEALAGLNPIENDILKGQDSFTTFSDGKWIGTLTGMNPGNGYMYFSGQNTSFIYPKAYPTPIAGARIVSKDSEPDTHWQYNAHQYADNMTLIGKLYSGDNLVGTADHIVAALVGNECRGIGRYVDGLVFMTIHGTMSLAETINFRVYSKETGKELGVTERLVFDGHNIGSVKQPMILHLSGATNISGVSSGFSISPRPLRNKLYINGDINSLKDVQILSVNGQKVLSVNHYSSDGIDVGNLIPGVYIVVLTKYDGTTYHEKVMKNNK